MSHAEICPICQGKGEVLGKKCYGCGGKGWVTVHDQYPVHPYPYPEPVPDVPRPWKREKWEIMCQTSL